ncbi:MAG: hypothetical protein BWY15_01942 [Firmicutes bacterium ADurb.Bin193]|nr:MAG: hypothetical protein BWY15_01942 [Firmicutes bacterium ADurb.Bin193]
MKDINNELVARFDSYTKTAFKHCLSHIRQKRNKLSDNETALDIETLNFASEDYYDFEENHVAVMDFDVIIKNDLLFELLNTMEQQQRDVIFLSACQKWSDKKIGEQLNLSRAKVQRIKSKVTGYLKKNMTGDDMHEK